MKIKIDKVVKIGAPAFLGGVFSLCMIGSLPDTNAEEASSQVKITVNPILSISSTDAAIDVSPNSAAGYNFTTGYSNVTVTTNDPTGYNLSIEGLDGQTTLHNSRSNTDIASITGTNILSTAFADNTWGYTVTAPGESTTYNPIPARTKEIYRDETDAATQTGGTTIPVYFGVKATADLPAGTYKGTVKFTAVANSVPTVPAFFTTATMQDVAGTPTFCSSATKPNADAVDIDDDGSHDGDPTYIPQTTLVDTRESSRNSYVIRKLADGNCWMVQNLNLGDSLTTADAVLSLTTEDSDVSDTFNLPASSGTSSDPNTESWTTDNPPTAAKMNNPGNIWFTNGTTQTTTQPTDSTQAATRSIGNYYNFWSATANHMTQTSPDYSICPKGWQLPANDGNKSWDNLITTTYGYSGGDSTASSTAGGTTLLNGPLQLVRSGDFNITSANSQGTSGYFWSGVQNSSTGGYYLFFGSSSLSPQNRNSKRYGYFIRCVSRQ